MSTPCEQKDIITETRDLVKGVESVHKSLIKSYETLSKSHEKIANSVESIQNILAKHLADLATANGRIDNANTRIDNSDEKIKNLAVKVDAIYQLELPELRGRIDSQKDSIAQLKNQIGSTNLSDLDTRIKISETLLRGGIYLAATFIAAVISIGVSIVYGGG